MRHFKIYLAIVIILAIISLIVYFSPVTFSYGDLLNGLIVEILGAIITFFVIDVALEKNEELKRKKMQKIGILSLRKTIEDLLNMFWRMRRASAKEALKETPENWIEAISSEEAINDIKHLDFLSCAGVYPRVNWNQFVANHFKNEYFPSIHRIIDSYGAFLSENIVEKLENFNNDRLFNRVFLIGHAFTSIETAKPILQLHEKELKAAIKHTLDIYDLYNKLFPDNKIYFDKNLNLKENQNPLLGTGRIE